MRLFDTHAHLQDARFDCDREAVTAAFTAGGGLIMDCGTDLEDSAKVAAFALAHEGVYAAVGVHPHEAKSLSPETLARLERLCENPKVRAIGEIGLDYHYDFSPRPQQLAAFEAQLDLAKKLKLPVIVHDREAHQDTMDVLRAHAGGLRGVMHCYSGSLEMAKRLLDMGFYVSLGGPVTFSNAARALEIAKLLPLERILIETDCPYLAPTPKRGKRNEPAFVDYVAGRIADIRLTTKESVASATFENGCALFGI